MHVEFTTPELISPGIDGYNDVGIRENEVLSIRTAMHVIIVFFIVPFPNLGRMKVNARR